MTVPFLSIYTPSTHEPAVLESLLVGREEVAARVVEDVVRSVNTKSKHHHLLIGPRGMGKTHLVSVIYHRIRARSLAGARIAWLREDPWGIRSIDKLAVAIATAIAEETGTPPVLRGDNETVTHFLQRLADNGTIVLLVENLDSVFARIKVEGQRTLRAFIQNTGCLVIVATTPFMFDGIRNQNEPFYGSFNVTKLDELSVDEAQVLLARVARLRGDLALADAIEEPRGRRRLEVIRHLAGGHPRLWMLFADSVTVDSLDDLVPLFLKALDDLTPYYQERMGGLDGQQEEIVAYLCSARGARTVGEIALRCGIEERTASAQLGKLAEKGLVRKAELLGLGNGHSELGLEHRGDKRRSHFELREPLMRLCLDVKESRGRPIRLIVEFLRAWFDRDALVSAAGDHPPKTLAMQYLEAALRDWPLDTRELRWSMMEIEDAQDRVLAMETALETKQFDEAQNQGNAALAELTGSGASPRDILAGRFNLFLAGFLSGAFWTIDELKAIAHDFARTIGPVDPETLQAKRILCDFLLHAGCPDEAIEEAESVHEDFKRLFGADSTKTRQSLCIVIITCLYAENWERGTTHLTNLRNLGESGVSDICILMKWLLININKIRIPMLYWSARSAPGELTEALLILALTTPDDEDVSPVSPKRMLEVYEYLLAAVGLGSVILETGYAIWSWRDDHDQNHLLSLPPELRSVAVKILQHSKTITQSEVSTLAKTASPSSD